MASSLLRGILARGIRSQTAQFLNGRRKLSKLSDSALAKSQSQVLKEWKLFGLFDIEVKLSYLRRPCFHPNDEQTFQDYIEFLIYNPIYHDSTLYPIDLSDASPVIRLVDRLIEHKPSSEYLYEAWYMIHNNKRFRSHSRAAKLKIMSEVLDAVQNYPQVDSKLVYELRVYLKSISVDDGEDILTKKQVISRVVDVVQSSPLVSQHVTTTTHFHKDLHLDEDGFRHILCALQMEFKMHLPLNTESCIGAIDYIYDNLDERMCLQEFLDEFEYAPKSVSRPF